MKYHDLSEDLKSEANDLIGELFGGEPPTLEIHVRDGRIVGISGDGDTFVCEGDSIDIFCSEPQKSEDGGLERYAIYYDGEFYHVSYQSQAPGSDEWMSQPFHVEIDNGAEARQIVEDAIREG